MHDLNVALKKKKLNHTYCTTPERRAFYRKRYYFRNDIFYFPDGTIERRHKRPKQVKDSWPAHILTHPAGHAKPGANQTEPVQTARAEQCSDGGRWWWWSSGVGGVEAATNAGGAEVGRKATSAGFGKCPSCGCSRCDYRCVFGWRCALHLWANRVAEIK